jgi:hypothetical protein
MTCKYPIFQHKELDFSNNNLLSVSIYRNFLILIIEKFLENASIRIPINKRSTQNSTKFAQNIL